MVKEKTNTTKNCLSILRTIMKEYKVNDCINEVFSSLI